MSATIIDVAKRAGVSFKTVSRVMNGESAVSEKTRVKVQKAAKDLDFRLNMAARSLRTQRSNLIALLIDNPSRSYVENIQIGAMQWCAENSHHLVIEDCSASHAGWEDLFRRSRIGGVILIPPMSDNPDVLKYLSDKDIPFVRIAPETENVRASQVRMNDVLAAKEMTQHLIAQGHRRIGFISGPKEFGVTRNRLSGYEAALKNAGIAFNETLIAQGSFSYESGLACAEDLLSLTPHPTAIFASNDEMAAATISASYKLGISVPEDVSVTGFDDAPIAAIMCPQLTTVRQPIKDMAKHAAQLLFERMRRPESEPQNIELAHDIIIRESTTKARS